MKKLTLGILLLNLLGCATMGTPDDTNKTMPTVAHHVSQKNLQAALEELKKVGYCDKPAMIGSNCGAWRIPYDLEGAPALYRTDDENRTGTLGTGGDDVLKGLIRLMASISDCSKLDDKGKMEACLEGRVIEKGYYRDPKLRFSQFKDFICGSVDNFNPSGNSYQNISYTPSEVFVLKSSFGSTWSPVKKIESSEMCKAHKSGAKQ